MKKEAKHFETYKSKTNRLKVKSISTTAGGNIKKPHKNNYSIFIDTETKDKQIEQSYCLNFNEKQFVNFLADLVDLYDCMHKKPLNLKKTDKKLKELGNK